LPEINKKDESFALSLQSRKQSVRVEELKKQLESYKPKVFKQLKKHQIKEESLLAINYSSIKEIEA
jgi:hypothetical protein